MEDQNLTEIFEELKKDTLNTDLIQDNALVFQYEKDTYRVNMPNQKENSEANNYKNKIYIKLLQEDNTLTIKQLTKLLKDKNNINIDELDKVAKNFEDEMGQIYLTLYKKKDTEKKIIEKLKKELDIIRQKRLEIVLEKAGYLAPAIENQTQDDYYRFMTCLCTEKLVDKNKKLWEQVWSSFEKYELDRSKLPYIALGKFTELMYGC